MISKAMFTSEMKQLEIAFNSDALTKEQVTLYFKLINELHFCTEDRFKNSIKKIIEIETKLPQNPFALIRKYMFEEFQSKQVKI